MNAFLVGGAVRDELLDLPIGERDWVVVGATAEELERQGFRSVGRDFPVFLHPETHEQYALARTERKTAPGYRGFVVDASPDVTLEQDLARRDLTINAMARDAASGELVDPWGGRADLEARVLRHVSAAFVEDPVRVLRVARFAARFVSLGFTVAPETLRLMQQMAASGEVDALVPERVWQETQRALAAESPRAFFDVLRDARCLVRVFPEIDRLFGVPQPARWHPEIDTGLHTLMVLEQAARLSDDPSVRFAALTHDLGKGETPQDHWPRHVGHEQRSVRLIDSLCARLRAPNEYRDLARLVARWHGLVHRAKELRASTLLELIENLDAFRRPDRFEQCLLACEADMRGRTGYEERPYPQAQRLRAAQAAATTVVLNRSALEGLAGPQIAERYRQARMEAITKAVDG